jgi:pimeloyl-ACP methyl ester carboxylesterase
MLEQFKTKGNKKMVRRLISAPVSNAYGTSAAYLTLRYKAMHSLGIGTTHDMKSIITGMFLPSLTCLEYTLTEKINLWRAKARYGVSILWDTILATDLAKEVPEINIPIYFFHGLYDYTVSYPLAKNYFVQIKAPLKGFYTFNNSAHSPIFEEPLLVKKN